MYRRESDTWIGLTIPGCWGSFGSESASNTTAIGRRRPTSSGSGASSSSTGDDIRGIWGVRLSRRFSRISQSTTMWPRQPRIRRSTLCSSCIGRCWARRCRGCRTCSGRGNPNGRGRPSPGPDGGHRLASCQPALWLGPAPHREPAAARAGPGLGAVPGDRPQRQGCEGPRHSLASRAGRPPARASGPVESASCSGPRARPRGAVYLPFALARKHPNAAREWRWQLVFPAAG